MKKSLSCVIVFLFFFLQSYSQENIFINEIMASNDTTITDATGDHADWFELYNAGTTDFSLSGCYITNDLSQPTLFRFSGDIQIPAKGYILIWASKDTTRGNTHVPFKLSASGESIFLYESDGETLLDSVSFGEQLTDISYGRQTDGDSTFVFFNKATPGATNNTSTSYKGFLNKLSLSVPAGFYSDPFSLTINSPDTGVKIIYTMDGSSPDTNNINGTVYRYKNQYPENPGESPYPFLKDSFISKIYSVPFMITDVSGNPNHLSIKSSTYDDTAYYFPTSVVNKGTVIRAMAVKDGYLSSPVTTATYFISPGGANKYTLPLISIAIAPNDMFSWDSGNYVAGVDFEHWRKKHPTSEIFHFAPANYRRDVTERASSLEMFDANAVSEIFQINNGTGIHGADSRCKPQKSFRIYFRGEYGASDLDYQIFPDQSYKDYERLILRNAGGDCNITHLCDMAIQTAVRHLNFNTQDSRPTVTFVNGEYWGILNIREYYDWHYFDQHYGIGENYVDYLTNNAQVHEGDSADYLQLRKYISDNDLTNPTVYDSVKNRIDIENYIDYYASEIFYDNSDWPTNNINYFRKRVPFTPGAPTGLDGRYRWVMSDLDQGLGDGPDDPSNNTLQRATGTNPDPTKNPPNWATVIMRKLTDNTDFRNEFITRYADLLNTSFQPDYIISVISYYHDLIAPEMQEHISRWTLPKSLYSWNRSVNKLDSFAAARPAYAREHLRDYFSLGTEQQITLNVSDTSAGYIHINTVDITPSFPGVPEIAYPWTGLYYSEVPVTLIAKAKTGYQFSHWEGDTSSTNDSITVTVNQSKSFTAVFEKTEPSEFIDYWHFNNLPDDDLTNVNADSTLTGGAFISYSGSGDGYMDATDDDDGSDINAQYGQPSGKALRARNPSSTRSLIITAPTTGFKKIKVDYAATRTNSGAEYQRVLYTVDGNNWILKQDSIYVSNPETEFALEDFDFTDIDAANNNPYFAVQVQFFGDNSTGSSGNNRFDNITVSGVADTSVLATQLILFNAKLAQADAVLNWSVSNQFNISKFEVQRSFNNINFTTIGNVHITSKSDYSFTDKNAGLLPYNYIYYRLKMTDKDGKLTYSNIIAIKLPATKHSMQVVPNPVQNYATIKFWSNSVQKATFSIKSYNGQLIKTEQFETSSGNNSHTFSTANLANGIYLITLKTDEGISTVRIVKQ